MIERFLIKKFFLYPFINRFKLWGGLIFLHKFARRGILHGWSAAIFMMLIAISLFWLLEIPLGLLRGIGMPAWIHFFAMLAYAIPIGGIMAIAFDLFLVGVRAPNKFIFGNLFWSESHDTRWRGYLSWLKDQKNGTEE